MMSYTSVQQWLDKSPMSAGKRKIIQSAVKLFAQFGYQGTTTAMIAQDAGLSNATMFKHFKSKEELLQKIVTPLISELVPLFSEQFLKDVKNHLVSIYDLMDYMIRDRYQFMNQNCQIVLIIINQFLTNEDVKQTIVKLLGPKEEQLQQIIQELLTTDQTTDSNLTASVIIQLFAGQMLISFLKRYKLNVVVDNEQEVAQIIANVQKVIRKNA
ncbi:TetR/AcrR family transcriptional regulator [Bombilactobacillus folatiphilus]|uniref:TetR/AcrR family transcriptional regulator n=1 Tax=Bombilactobacillus folatiphilus TaxID=2923362 RepID=A0ABY4PAA3_9LACO|nr:TetR/AcrR family transcriptional regulator [Bombilactobacillus folatiphilus]UQS82537.1 TetR/AcrR family transcriptional regulator [Bombilactobacillus folatiphilus]